MPKRSAIFVRFERATGASRASTSTNSRTSARSLRAGSLEARDRLLQAAEGDVGTRLAKLVDGVVTRGDADGDGVDGMACLDVFRCVAHDVEAVAVDPAPEGRARPLHRAARELVALRGIGSVTAEREESVQA